jgi:hypothetical protein
VKRQARVTASHPLFTARAVQVRTRVVTSLARPRAQPYFNTRLFPFLAEVLVAENPARGTGHFLEMDAISSASGAIRGSAFFVCAAPSVMALRTRFTFIQRIETASPNATQLK